METAWTGLVREWTGGLTAPLSAQTCVYKGSVLLQCKMDAGLCSMKK